MKLTFIFTLLFTFSTQVSFANECEHLSRTFRCIEVVSIYDGDSIKVNIPNLHVFFAEEMSVRVSNIDTAERYGNRPCEREMAKLARNYINHRLSLAQDHTSVELRRIQKDKYFRVNAEVWVNGYSLGNALIDENLAVPYYGGTKPKTNWCKMKRKVSEYIKDLEGF